MDDPHEQPPQPSEIKSVLPDVVHSQQIPAVGTDGDDRAEIPKIDTGQSSACDNPSSQDADNTETESISEHIPSKMEFSESDNATKSHESGLLKVKGEQEKVSRTSSMNVPSIHSPLSDNPSTQDPSRQSASWPDVNPIYVHHLSEESPVNLASSDLSKEETHDKSCSPNPQDSEHETPKESPRSDIYLDSLNEESSQQDISIGDVSGKSSGSDKVESQSSGSEEIIKLDIRGQGVPKFPLPTAKIIFGPPPEGSTVISGNIEPIPVFQNLLSPFLVGAGDSIQVEEIFDDIDAQSKAASDRSPELSQSKEVSPERSDETPEEQSSSDKEQDVLIEEVTIDDTKEKDNERLDDASIPTQPKSMAPEETASFSTYTDYKSICEEYHVKLVHLEDAITQRDELIEELTVSLQQSVKERDDLRSENVHLNNEVHTLQHVVAEQSEQETIKGQLSDFIKYEAMIKDDSTKFYSALMSSGSSIKSSIGEKDTERGEEITVNYSRSDLKTSESSEDFQAGLENQVTTVINKFDNCIEENLRNKLRESVIQVLCNEMAKLRLENDTEIKELESQMQQDKQSYTIETRRLRELLASVKAGNAEIDALRQELNTKHEKEMENLRMYFEKKCTDMERSYSEEVWRGRAVSSRGSASSLEGEAGAGAGAGDCANTRKRRTRSAEFPSLTMECTSLEQGLKQTCKRLEQQLEDARTEHASVVVELQARHRGVVGALQEQINTLKAHLQTAENTENNVSVYQQDIDLELEKQREHFEKRLEEVRQEVVQQLQDQIQVLLSDPDAEVSSWPLELVALRDKIHGDAKAQQERELSSLRDELTSGESDKWKHRRNISFDQNRQLEEVTKERDGLKRVAVTLQRVVAQLVAYCACAEDELNKTVLAQLLARLQHTDDTLEEESRPTTPNNVSVDLDTSVVTRGKHVHFAPDLRSVLAELDEDALLTFLQQQRDLSADIKQELELSLARLRHEAHELLDLSAKMSNTRRHDSKMLEGPPVLITELVEKMENKDRNCDNCEMHKKSMEEEMSECLQRENLLRADLEGAMMKIAQLMNSERSPYTDLIAEGYGTAAPASLLTLPVRARTDVGPQSLDGCSSPRTHLVRMAQDMDALVKERDDLQQQVKRMTDSPVHKICCEKLEAANRQLRSTRQFVEEQASEREVERDEFAKRLAELRDENARLATRLQNNARILNEVEQLEAQTREMNQIISELENRKSAADEEIKSTEEKIIILRDIIATLESQLEQKTAREKDVLEQLEQMKNTIEERDSKMRSLLSELQALRSERVENSDVSCVKCDQEEDKYAELLENIKEQSRLLEDKIHRRTQRLERIHEVCSASCSEPSEDVSLREHKNRDLQVDSPETGLSPRVDRGGELAGVWECLESLARAEDAAVKRIADLEMQRRQLKDVAQEVRAERDVLQARMSEQALKISSLSARLQQHRNDAEALAHHAHSQLGVQLHDAHAEVQRLREELEAKDKQLLRVKQNLEERDKLSEQHHSLYGNSCNPKDKVVILERELSSAQSRIAQLESLARSLETDKEEMQAALRDRQRELAEKEDQLQELLALKLDEDENQKEEKSELMEGPKASARTLSDIVSISEFDEQDLQMRRDELKAHNISLNEPFVTENRVKNINMTPAPNVQKPNMSSLNIELGDHFDTTCFSPRADSLPILKHYKRNVNETTVFGTIEFGDSVKHSTAQKIPDNCSMYPNRDISGSKNVTVEPKKINFSMEPSHDNRTQDNDEFTSLRELGIVLDFRQENFPDILTQLKHEIKKSRSQLETCKSELKNAEEQLCEFPALKEEVEELKSLLENTMATMENDKKFYENQLDNFSSNKKLLEQRLTELTQEVNDKSKDLHLLKEDMLRRENMILELAKEKRNLTNKMTELQVKIDELQSRNSALEKNESENHQMRDKMIELSKLQQLVSEKNQQIDSLNQHLDRLDNLQRCLDDKTEKFDNLKEAFDEKNNELFQLQETIDALNRDISKANEDNSHLITENKDLKLKLSKVEKEQENTSLKLQSNEAELERVNSLNNELASKIDELKQLTDKLKDKETEIEILHEDINSYHEEIASLKEQLKMASRSPSPRAKGEERRSLDRQAGSDKRQLAKIRKQVSVIQNELDYTRKQLNETTFQLAKSNLSVTELTNSLSQANKLALDKDAANSELTERVNTMQREMELLQNEKSKLREQLEAVVARIREESNIDELKSKLLEKSQRCSELEAELQDLRDLVDRLRSSPDQEQVRPGDEKALVVSGTRSPTAELERALRDQLNYSHSLDEDIMEQILSASSDDREDIPRLALNTSNSCSSMQSTSSERLQRLRADNEKLQLQLTNLDARLKDKDALITELNRVRDKLVQECQTNKLRYETERDNAARLQLLLDTQKETAESLQNQDSNMIGILKKRLESSMQSELELQRREQELRARTVQLERQVLGGCGDEGRAQLQNEMENNVRLKGEVSLLKSKLEAERARRKDAAAEGDAARAQAQRELQARADQLAAARRDLADMKRLKHEAGVELLRAKELLNIQCSTIAELERRLTAAKQRPFTDALTEIEGHKSELAHEIASLKKCLSERGGAEVSSLRTERRELQARVAALEAELGARAPADERDQAIRYLHGRCLRLESCRKALVWQKRYLQRVLAGYADLERKLRLGAHGVTASGAGADSPRGKRRFKCVATAVIIVLRMGFLVRRRQHVRALSANCILRPRGARAADTVVQVTTSPSPMSHGGSVVVGGTHGPADTLTRRVLKQDLRLNVNAANNPAAVSEFRRAAFNSTSPRDESFVLSSPRGEMATAYLNKLELVSRCLNQAMDAPRDVP